MTADDVLAAVAVELWRVTYGNDVECREWHIPDMEALCAWWPRCPPAALEEANRRGAALRPGAAWEPLITARVDKKYHGRVEIGPLPEDHGVYAGLLKGDHESSPHFRPQLVIVDGDGRKIEAGVFSTALFLRFGLNGADLLSVVGVHQAWERMTEGEQPKHPLGPLVAAWQARGKDAASVDMEAVAANGERYTRAARLRDMAGAPLERVSWGTRPGEAGVNVEALRVDGEPFASRIATAAPVAYRPRKVDRAGQYSLGFVPPATLNREAVRDVIVVAMSQLRLDGDERELLRGDTQYLLGWCHALSGRVELTEEQGAVLVGGRDSEANRKRYNAAAVLARALVMIVNARTGTPLPLADVDWPAKGLTVIGPPAWWRTGRGTQSRLTARVYRTMAPAARGPADRARALERTLDGFESMLFWARAPGRGKGGRTSALLLPVGKRALHGHAIDVDARAVLVGAGEYVPEGPFSARDMKRYKRRVDALMAAGYGANGRREAKAGDSIEIVEVLKGGHNHPARVRIRASARFVEAARKRGRRDEYAREPVAHFLDRRRRGGG